MADQISSNQDRDEIDEILMKIISGRTVIKSLAERALLFYRQRKKDFLFYKEFYKSHTNDTEQEENRHESSSKQIPIKHQDGEKETATTTGEELNELKNETEKLREENRGLREEVEKKEDNSELNDSSRGVDKLTDQITDKETIEMANKSTEDVNPHATYTPVNLVERFRQVYEGEWKHALDDLIKANSEKSLLIKSLADVLKEIDKFCIDVCKQQLESIKKHVIEEITYPKYRLESGDVMGGLHRAIVEEHQHELAGKLLVNLRKHLGILSAGPLYQIFSNYQTELPGSSEAMHSFIMKTTEIVWMMKIQEPPMELEWTYPGFTHDKRKFRVYSNSGSVVQQCVWPAVFQYLDGPLMSKGVILAS